MRKNLRSISALCLSMVLALSLTACGGGGGSSEAPPAESPASSDAASPAESPSEAEAPSDDAAAPETTGDREMITFYRTNDGNGAVEALIEGFEASQDKYGVKWVEASNDTDTSRNQLNTAFSAGSSEYDIVSIDVIWAGDMAAAGYLEPLDSYIMDSGHNLSEYNPGSLQAGTYKAKTYALPLYPDFGALFIRKDIVSEEDVSKLVSGDYTWDELITMAETYSGQGDTKVGLNFQSNQYEGLVCNANEWTKNFTEVRSGLELMKKAVDSTATPENILVYQESETANSFVNGEAVFSRNWPYQWGLLGADDAVVKQDQVEIAPLPWGNCIGGWLVAMNANSANKEGAWAFLNYITSMDGQRDFCSLGGYVPGFTAAASDPEVLAANELLSKPGFVAALNNTIGRPVSDNYAELSNGLQISIHKYLSGNQDLDTTVTEVEALVAPAE